MIQMIVKSKKELRVNLDAIGGVKEPRDSMYRKDQLVSNDRLIFQSI